MKTATKPSPAEKLAIRAAAAKSREKQIAKLERRHRVATKRAEKASEARRLLPAGSSRARVTTANARWADAAGERDRLANELAALRG